MPVIRQASTIEELLKDLHARLAGCLDGAVADYIPELAKADPRDFGIVIAMADGRIYAVGDTEKAFTIQSILQRLAVDARHDKKWQRTAGVDRQNRHDVRMNDRGCRTSLTGKAFASRND